MEKVIRIEAKRAKADGSRLASFKALRLNMGTSDVAESLLLPADTWARCEGDADAVGPYILGLDLGGSYAQSAACGYWPQTGRLDAFACFPAMPDLVERGLFDGTSMTCPPRSVTRWAIRPATTVLPPPVGRT